MAAGDIFPKTAARRFASLRFSSRVICAFRRSSVVGRPSCHSKYRVMRASSVPGSMALPFSASARSIACFLISAIVSLLRAGAETHGFASQPWPRAALRLTVWTRKLMALLVASQRPPEPGV
ncbi:hypothetical protein WI76_27065 [Burkholderia ubonensis]|nr:hypothetical protein WI76_27065 [Burkholderia ubonensis]